MHLRLKTLILPALLWCAAISPLRAEAPAMPAYGSDKAPYSFMVWGAFTCPFTRKIMPVLKQIVDDSNGKVRLEWRHYPVHPPDPSLHVLAQADPDRFWDFTFAFMQALDAQPNNSDYPSVAKTAAEKVGVDLAKFSAAEEDAAKWDIVKQDFLAGRLLGVGFTPGIFFDGYFLTPKGPPMDTKAFEASLRTMVQQAKP